MNRKSNRIIIAGGRDFEDYPLLKKTMDHLTKNLPIDSIEVVCGGAKGADSEGDYWATSMFIPVTYFIPDWEGQGKAAGHIRNRAMGDYATHLVAFWDGKSKGTKVMIDYANKLGLKVRVIRYEGI